MASAGAYYNENDPKAAAWLRELIKAGLIADGEVDTRSIVDVRPDDFRGFVQCHFFAGIGGWSYALRLAGWSDNRRVWTGSCPCQPFSSAGSQAGGADARDLWPAWFRLIAECGPVVVFGEQVESAIDHGWLDRLCDDLEGKDYAVWPVGLPSASVGAFDIRQRLWFVAESESQQHDGDWNSRTGRAEPSDGGDVADADGRESCNSDLQRSGRHHEQPEDAPACLMAYATSGGFGIDRSAPRQAGHVDERKPVIGVANTSGERQQRERLLLQQRQSQQDRAEATRGGASDIVGDSDSEREAAFGGISGGPTVERGRSPWAEADWLYCRDGRWRPVEPGTFPLAHGLPARLGRLRGYGNAINPYVAAEVIAAYMEICADVRISSNEIPGEGLTR